jgi:hypothetical protein
LGSVKAGMVVPEVSLRIVDAFDGGTTISVGDSAIHARLMLVTDNFASVPSNYESDPNYRYLNDLDLYIYFPSGIPSVGSGEVIVYLA